MPCPSWARVLAPPSGGGVAQWKSTRLIIVLSLVRSQPPPPVPDAGGQPQCPYVVGGERWWGFSTLRPRWDPCGPGSVRDAPALLGFATGGGLAGAIVVVSPPITNLRRGLSTAVGRGMRSRGDSTAHNGGIPPERGPWDPFTGGVGEPLAQRSTRCSARAGKPSAGGAGRGDRARSRPPGGPAPGLPIGRVGGPRRLRGTAGPVSGAAIRGPLATQGGAGGAVRTAPRSMARRRRPAPSWSRSIPGPVAHRPRLWGGRPSIPAVAGRARRRRLRPPRPCRRERRRERPWARSHLSPTGDGGPAVA